MQINTCNNKTSKCFSEKTIKIQLQIFCCFKKVNGLEMESTTNIVFQSRTNSTLSGNYMARADWIIPFTINVILLILTLWILIALIHYGIVTGKWQSTQTTKSEILNVGRIYSSVVACAVACLAYYINHIVYLNIGYEEEQDELCDSVGDAAISIYGVILFTGSTFYWLRQRVFFSNNMLNANYNKFVQVLSLSSIVIVIGGGLTVLIINCIPDNRTSGPEGCTFKPKDENRTSYWIPILAIILLAQVMLLGLLFYALKKTNKKRMRSKSKQFQGTSQVDCNSETINSVDNSVALRNRSATSAKTIKKKRSSRCTVRSILRKTILFAILSFLAEIFNQIYIHYIASPTGHRRHVTTLGNLTAFSNLIFIILSFLQYKKIFMSPLRSICKNGSKKINSTVIQRN